MRTVSFFVPIVIAALVAGCAGRANVNAGFAGSTRTTTGGTTTTSGGSVGVQIQGGSAAAAVIGIAVMGAAIAGSERAQSRGGAGFAPTGSAPPLDETRKVREVDCTKPIEDYSVNIKCK